LNVVYGLGHFRARLCRAASFENDAKIHEETIVEDLVVEYCWTKTEFYRAIRRSVCVTIFQAMYIIVAAVTAIFFHIVVFAVLICIFLWVIASFVTRPIMVWNRVIGIREPRRVIFNDEGITTITSAKTSTVGWPRFRRSKETSKYYLIIGKRSSVASPFKKTVFANTIDEARFRSLLRNHTHAALRPNALLDNLVLGDRD